MIGNPHADTASDVRTRNTAVRRYSRGTAFFTLVRSRRGGRHRHDRHDEATRWWFGQAGRQRPSHVGCGLSAAAWTPSQGGRETTPPAVHWSVREQSNGYQGVPEVLGKHFHGATRGPRVAASWRQVQHGPRLPRRFAGCRLRCSPVSHGRFRQAQYADCVGGNRRAGSAARAACDPMRRIGSGSCQRHARRCPAGGGACPMVAVRSRWGSASGSTVARCARRSRVEEVPGAA